MMPSKLSLLKVWILITVLGAGLWSLSSCQKIKQPSMIIIAVDRLSFNSFSCSDDKQNAKSGLNLLCKEAIRFTHAYTTSIQPAAAMASLLTGLYPIQHQLHRSFDHLQPKTLMIQEKALRLGYRTYFFGGGPSILKKTGLSIGFDIFDDLSFLEKKTYFLDFKHQTEKFLNVIQNDAEPFFSVLYNSELESPNEGETEVSSLERLDEKFFNFFTELKTKKLWDENYVVVMGLQGDSDATRLSETPFSNLNSENTMITLFVKPPRSKGDEGISWKVDSPINTADLGLSLWSTLTGHENAPQNLRLSSQLHSVNNSLEAYFPLIDFSGIWLTKNQSLLTPSRKILIEAADTWSSETFLRFSVLNKNLVYIESEKNKVYNALTDGLQSIDVSAQQKQFVHDIDFLLESVRNYYKIKSWKNYKSHWDEWILTNREYWSKPNSRNQLFKKEFERLIKKPSEANQPLTALLQRHLIKNKKINDLQALKNLTHQNNSIPFNEKQRDAFFENAKLNSLNLALENIWGLWMPNKDWLYSDFTLENQ